MATTNPLFKFGVDIEKTDADGKTMLHRAAMFSDQDKACALPLPQTQLSKTMSTLSRVSNTAACKMPFIM
jgi:hypothetical protein